jgi:hypothetical protein
MAGAPQASKTVADALARLTAAVTADTTVEASATTLMNGFGAFVANLKATLAGMGATPEQLAAIDTQSAALEASSPALVAAVTAGTSAES